MIKDLKELEALLKLCRKQGVKDIKFGDCAVVFGDLQKKRKEDGDSADVPTDEPSAEELMFYSSGGIPPA